MKKRLRGFYLIVSSLVIALLHLPFAFAKSATSGTKAFLQPLSDSLLKPRTIQPPVSLSVIRSVYDSLQLNLKGLSHQAYDYARQGFDKLIKEGRIINDSIVSVVDFSQPSNIKRLFIIDIKNYKVLFNSLVAHGRNSGKEIATSFSNQNESYKSSPGFYITGESYEGKKGYSLKLQGIEPGINNNAFERGIIIHGADYVSDNYINMQGYIGRSQGCPAVPIELNRPIIDAIKNGTCLFMYHPSYTSRSLVLR